MSWVFSRRLGSISVLNSRVMCTYENQLVHIPLENQNSNESVTMGKHSRNGFIQKRTQFLFFIKKKKKNRAL